MDWRNIKDRIGILLCTVLVTVCPPAESSLLNFDYMPESHDIFTVDGCPPNTIFCLERKMCVNLDGTCIEPPTCHPDEVPQTNMYGHQQCILFENTCWPYVEEACVVDGMLMCVQKGQCHSLEVKLRVEGSYSDVVGDNYEVISRRFKTQIATETGLKPQQLLDFHLQPGSVYIIFRAPLSAYDIFSSAADDQLQFLTDESNNLLAIDWAQSWMGEKRPDNLLEEEHFDPWQFCKPGQLYCFQSKSCINVDGTCPAEPTCQLHQILCNTGGKLECVDHGSCVYMEGYIYLRDSDFDAVIGANFERMNEFTDHFKTTLAVVLSGSTNDIWGVWFEKGSISIHFSATQHSYDSFMELMNQQQQFVTDIDGNQLLIAWEYSYAYVHKEWRHDNGDIIDWNEPDFCPDCHNYNGHHCGSNELFCFETMSCVNADGQCAYPHCQESQAVCYIDSKFQCADYCEYVAFNLVIRANFTQLVGSYYENYESVKKSLLKQIAEALNTESNMLMDASMWQGSVMFWARAPYHLYDRLYSLLMIDRSLSLIYDGVALDIDFEKVEVYKEMFDGENGWSDDRGFTDGDGPDSCPDCYNNDGHNCGYNELFCFETMSCVTADGQCTHPHCQESQAMCYVDSKFQCSDYCEYATFNLVIKANYSKLVGSYDENYESVKMAFLEKIAIALQCEPNMLMDASLWQGSVMFWARAPYHLYDRLYNILMVDRSLVLTYSGVALEIDFDKSKVYREIFDHDRGYTAEGGSDYCPDCYKDDEHMCGYNELFCFETMSCVATDGHCSTTQCQNSQAVCYIDSQFQCADFCEYAAFILTIRANFSKLVGSHYENYESVKKALLDQIADALQVGPEMLMDASIWSGSVMFWARAPYHLYDRLYNILLVDRAISLTYGGVALDIDFDKVHVYRETFDDVNGWRDDKDPSGPDLCSDCDHDQGHMCGYNELFCFETMSCVPVNSQCTLPHCYDLQALCYIEEKLQCSDSCSYTEFLLHVDANFFELVGMNYERYESVKLALVEQIANALGVKTNMFIESQMWNGSLIFWARLPHYLFDHLQTLLVVEKRLSLTYNDVSLMIHFDKVEIYEQKFEHGQYWSNYGGDGLNGDHDYCPDCDHDDGNVCGYNELFCFETLQCVNQDGGCTDDSSCSNSEEELCPDGNGNYVCQPREYCYSDDTRDTLYGEFILDADYAQYTDKDNGTSLIYDLKMAVSKIANIDPADITDVFVRPGSIIAGMTFNGLPEDLRTVMTAIQNHVYNNGTIIIGGTAVAILSFIPEVVIDSEHYGCNGDECHDDKWHMCGYDEVFCFETLQCLAKNGGCTDTGSEKCSSPEEEACPDGTGGYICKAVGSCGDISVLFIAEVSITLDGDYTAIVGVDKGAVIQELQTIIPQQIGSSPDKLKVIDLTMGSIIIFVQIGPVYPAELGLIIENLKKLMYTNGTIAISGTSLNLISVDTVYISEYQDHYDGGLPHSETDSSQTCPTGQIFCMEKTTCVGMEYNAADCQPEVARCSQTEEFCLDPLGYGTCVVKGTCSIKSVRLTILTNGSYDLVIEHETVVVQQLIKQISVLLDVAENDIQGINLFQGSLGIEIDLSLMDPTKLDPLLSIFEEKVMSSKVLLEILGTRYLVRPDSFTVMVELVNFEQECELTGSCLDCQELQTQCYNFDSSKTVSCVPKSICRLESVCPITQADAVSTCITECDPRKDMKNAAGDLCCPNACGGGVYMTVSESYVCPRDKYTGMCLTLEDTKCESGMDWCAVSFTCETLEMCDFLASKHAVDDVTTSDRFIIRIPLLVIWEETVSIFKSSVSETSYFKEALIDFQTSAKETIEQAITSSENMASIENVAVYPEGTDLHQLSVYADVVSTIPGALILEDIKDKVNGLTLSSKYFPETKHVLEDPPTVVAALGNAKRQVYLRSEPIIAGIDSTFSLLSVVPYEQFTSKTVTLNCNIEGIEIFIDDASQQTAEISFEQSISIRHSLPEITTAECEIISTQNTISQDDTQFFLGLILLPTSITKLASVTIATNEEVSIVTDEDTTECIRLPDNTFDLHPEGDALFEVVHNWPMQMTGSGEIWHTSGGLPLSGVIQNLLLSYHVARSATLQNLRTTVTIDPISAAKLFYKGEPLRESDIIDVLTSAENLQQLEICVAGDYSGPINLAITPGLSDSTKGNTTHVLITVNAVNDPPSSKQVEDSYVQDDFAHPSVSEGGVDDTSVSEITVSSLVTALFEDLDSKDTLGMALVGPIAATTGGVVGQWQYSTDGLEWTDISDIARQDSEEINLTLTLLHPTDKLRFTTQDVRSWTINEAPKLVFLAWDGSNSDDIGNALTDVVTLTKCNLLKKGFRQYCRRDGDSAYSSDIVVLPLVRRGCDGVANSGKVALRCGCADDTSCLDCHNVPNGNAVIDACGVCGGSNMKIDCTVSECRHNNSEYCALKDEVQESVNSMCDEGEELVSTDYYQYCEQRCIKTGDDVRNICDLPCDMFECLDCANETGKNEINLCGVCRPIETLNEGCESIGHIVPSFSNSWKVMNISVDVANSLVPTVTPEITCFLEPKDSTATNIQVPTVTSTHFIPGNEATPPSVVLTLQTDITNSELSPLGEFAVVCAINGNSVSTADTSQYFLLYDNPTLDSVTPEYSLLTQLSDVTVTGVGIFDTGKLFCVISCLESDECVFRTAKGVRVSETEAVCPMRELIHRKLGGAYTLYVLIDTLDNIDNTRLTQSNGVIFRVVMPAPSAISANLNKDECNTITVQFDNRVVGPTDEDCTGDEVKCILPARSKMLYIENVNSAMENQELRFKDNVIKHAAEKNDDTSFVNFLTGSVIVQGEEGPVVEIDRNIPGKVGCTAVTLKPVVKYKGCWDIVMTWTVTAEGVDANHISDLHNEIAQRTSFQVAGSQLQDGVVYTFTLDWSAGKHSGTGQVTLTKDPESAASVSIYGIAEEYDVFDTVGVKAKIRPCDVNDNNIAIFWTLTPAEVQLEYTTRTFTRIEAGSLKPKNTYELSCTVTFGNGDTVTDTATFRTRARPIEAGIRYGDDVSTQPRDLKEDEDLTLSCENIDDTTGENDFTCIWTCKTNFLGENEDEMLPCLEVVDGQFVQLERTGQSIALDGSNRLRPPRNFNLKQEWTVIMERDGQTSVSRKMFEFKKVITELHAPEIRRKKEDKDTYYISETITTVRIETYCRRATSYKWETSDEDGMAVFPFDIFKGVTTEDMKSDDTYKECSIELDFSDPNGNTLIPGELYAVKLTVLNLMDNVYLSKSDQFFIQYIQKPRQGIVSVISEDLPIVSWNTKLSVSLTGWWDALDGTNLKCHVYYYTDSMEKSRINTLPMNADESISFSLPEGKFTIEAKCCNTYDKCARGTADEELTVQASNSTQIVSSFEQDLTRLTTIESDILIGFVKEIRKVLKTVVLDETESERTSSLLQEALKQSIFTAFAKSSDRKSKLAAMEKAAEVVTPKDLDRDSKSGLIDEASVFVKEATGRADPLRKRKRRSATKFSQPAGVTETEAVTILNVFDSTITQDSMTEEDAVSFKDTIDDLLIGLCQSFTGSSPWVAPAQLSYLRVQRTNLNGIASVETDVSCGTCTEVEYPAKVNYGNYLETVFNDTWTCTAYTECSDICVATAQLNVDTVTLTAGNSAVAPTRMSDIIMLKMINPETYAVETFDDLNPPVEATLTLNGTVDMETYEYKCLMWLSNDWSDIPCNTSSPTFDETTSKYKAVCMCNALGIISIFQELKPEEIITTTLTTPTETTSDEVNTDSSITQAPSKEIDSNTDFVEIQFSFIDDFEESVGSSETALKNKIKADLAAQTGYSQDSFRNLQIAPGSIIVTFELHTAESGSTLGQMVYKIENMLNGGTITFSTTDGTPLNIKPGSFKYEQVDDDKEEESSGSSNLPMIIGAALGGLVVICITVVVVLLILKNKKQKTHPHNTGSNVLPAPRYNTPPPTYAVAPPPPYMYVDPPQVNKWVENELDKQQKKPFVDGRPISSGSNGSGSSFDQRVNNKAKSLEPTPVGE